MRAQGLFLLLMTGMGLRGYAQAPLPGKDTVMKGATIEVLQAYKPQVKQAPKPEFVPQLPPPDTTHAVASYEDVPQQSLYYTYTSLPLHPLALGRDIATLPFPNYVKLGGGNLSTIYLDAGIGGIYGDGYETAIHLHHLSQKGSIANQQSALSGVEAEGMFHGGSTDWHAAVNAERNQYYNYGHLPYVVALPADSLKQTYTTIRALVDVQNRVDSLQWLGYHPGINASLYTGRYSTTETNFGFNAPFFFRIEHNLEVLAGVSGSVVNLKADTLRTTNNFIMANAGFGYHNKWFSGHAVLGYAFGKDSKKYFLPDIQAAYTFPKTQFGIFAGMQSTLRQNTYEQLTTENPYLINTYPTRQTSRGEYFGGVQGGSGNHFSYSARFSYWDYQYLQAYTNDFGDQRLFRVGYYMDDVTALSLKLSVRYAVGVKWSAGLAGDFYRFKDPGGLTYVIGQPSTRIMADFRIMPSKKFTASAYLSVLGGINAINSFHVSEKLKTIADLGANAEYLVVPRLGVFLVADNLLNYKYQRWLGYQAYGLNIYGGLRLKF